MNKAYYIASTCLFIICCLCISFEESDNNICIDTAKLPKAIADTSYHYPEREYSKTVVCEDVEKPLSEYLKYENCSYVIKSHFAFSQKIIVPNNSALLFDGGSVQGNLELYNTELCGMIHLQGSILSGSIYNSVMESSWICYGNGIDDDSKNIQSAINISDSIHFHRGSYRLNDTHTPALISDNKYHKSIDSYIGIYRSNIHIKGDKGVYFLPDLPKTCICIYSEPNNIWNQIKNIEIDRINIVVNNSDNIFYEFFHSIKVIGVQNCIIKNCCFYDFWGDGICLSHYGDDITTGERTRNINVKICNNKIYGGATHNNRNGISIISGENILIAGNEIRGTSRSDMPGAIDIEANNSVYTVKSIIIRNNIISDCYGLTGGICIIANTAGGSAYDISIIENNIINCPNGIGFGIYANNTVSDIKIIGNHFDNNTNPYLFDGTGTTSNWLFQNNRCDRISMRKYGGKIRINNLKYTE